MTVDGVSDTTRPAYVWSGSEWVPVGDGSGGGGAGGGGSYGNDPPANPQIGDIWMDADGLSGGGSSSGGVPLGTVVAYHGATAPVGWLLCDGQPVPASAALHSMLTNTPDLRDKFVMGAAAPGTTGGANSHTHAQALHQHTQAFPLRADNQSGGAGGILGYGPHNTPVFGIGDHISYPNRGPFGVGAEGTPVEGYGYLTNTEWGGKKSTDATSSLPPYYALVYIIRSELVAADVADLTALDARYEPKRRFISGAVNSGSDGSVTIQFPAGLFDTFPHMSITPIVGPAIWFCDNGNRSATHYRIVACHADGSPWPDIWCDWMAWL